MDALEYIKERVEHQIKWYDTKSKWNQRGYKIARVVEIVCAVSIPFIMGYVSDANPTLKFVAGLLGVIVAVIAGLVSLYQFYIAPLESETVRWLRVFPSPRAPRAGGEGRSWRRSLIAEESLPMFSHTQSQGGTCYGQSIRTECR